MVQQAVNALGERQRIALTLSKFEGLSYQEIADSMELSVKAVQIIAQSSSRESAIAPSTPTSIKGCH